MTRYLVNYVSVERYKCSVQVEADSPGAARDAVEDWDDSMCDGGTIDSDYDETDYREILDVDEITEE